MIINHYDAIISQVLLPKILSDAISEHLILKIFLEGMPPDPLASACYACCDDGQCAFLLLISHSQETSKVGASGLVEAILVLY